LRNFISLFYMSSRSDSAASSSNHGSGKTASVTDEVLWNNIKSGNELAMSMLYKKYVQRLYDYGMHACRDHDLVMDCLQDLFFKVWNKREAISDVHFVKPYLFKSFRRLFIHQLIENRKHSSPLSEQVAFEFMPSIEAVLIEDEAKVEQTNLLKKCVQSLTKGQREVIYLKFYNELSYKEIAEVTELQVDSVYNLVSKTLELLRKKLEVAKPHLPMY
jgi:RNA polymerase sigma factor (sigma-70 family)